MSEICVGNFVELSYHPAWRGTHLRVTHIHPDNVLGVVVHHGAPNNSSQMHVVRNRWPVGSSVSFSARDVTVVAGSGFGGWYRRHS